MKITIEQTTTRTAIVRLGTYHMSIEWNNEHEKRYKIKTATNLLLEKEGEMTRNGQRFPVPNRYPFEVIRSVVRRYKPSRSTIESLNR